jgi:hypothetical protein
LQTNFCPISTAVPFDISESFLGDPKKTQRRVCRNATGNILVRKVNLYFLLFRELLTEGFDPCHQT